MEEDGSTEREERWSAPLLRSALSNFLGATPGKTSRKLFVFSNKQRNHEKRAPTKPCYYNSSSKKMGGRYGAMGVNKLHLELIKEKVNIFGG